MPIEMVSLLSFCTYDGLDLTELTLTAFRDDCESGRSETEPTLSAEQLMAMSVTGKKNCNSVTGNTVCYIFTDTEGHTAATFTFYDGLLLMDDGMYTVE